MFLRRVTFGVLLVAVAMTAICVNSYSPIFPSPEPPKDPFVQLYNEGALVWRDRIDGKLKVVFAYSADQESEQMELIGTTVENNAGRFDDTDLPILTQLKELRAVDFKGSTVTAAAIEQFRKAHPHLDVKP